MNLNILDFVFLIVIILSMVFGISKGFLRELFSLVFFIIAVFLSFLYYFEAGNIFLKQIKNREAANFIGFLLIFLSVLIVGSLVTYSIKKIFIIGPLKSIDRILGGAFGLLRGIFISAVLVLGLISFPVDDHLVTESHLSPFLLRTIEVFFDVFPQKFKQKFRFFNDQERKNNDRSSRTI